MFDAVLTALRPPGVIQPFWNPWFGAMFLFAELAAGWAVLSGHRRWWAVVVITGSVATQAHLMYVLPAVALIVVALAAGVADCARVQGTYVWLITGALGGAACWSAPVIQELIGRPGNLTALLGRQGTGKLTGADFGLKALTASAQPRPAWWAHPPGGLGGVPPD